MTFNAGNSDDAARSFYPPAATDPRLDVEAGLVVRTDRLEVRSALTGSECLVITFSPRVDRPGNIWGGAPLRKAGIAAIGLFDTSESWFPAEDMARAIEAIRPIAAKYRRVVTYGHSMGAYAALKYSRALGAHAAFALSPQATLEPHEIESFDPRRATLYYDKALHDGMGIGANDLCDDSFVIHDPSHAIDRPHARKILVHPQAKAIPVYFVDHGTLGPILDTKSSVALMQALVSEVPGDAVRSLFRAARKGSPSYLVGRGRALERRGAVLQARALFAEVAERFPKHKDVRARELKSSSAPDVEQGVTEKLAEALRGDELLPIERAAFAAMNRLTDAHAMARAILMVADDMPVEPDGLAFQMLALAQQRSSHRTLSFLAARLSMRARQKGELDGQLFVFPYSQGSARGGVLARLSGLRLDTGGFRLDIDADTDWLDDIDPASVRIEVVETGGGLLASRSLQAPWWQRMVGIRVRTGVHFLAFANEPLGIRICALSGDVPALDAGTLNGVTLKRSLLSSLFGCLRASVPLRRHLRPARLAEVLRGVAISGTPAGK